MGIMLPRVMPCLLLQGTGLIKTVKFKNPTYLGDPRNVVKIFNEKEVDELVLLDILATPQRKSIQFDLIHEIVSEAFMPVAYGGGIRNIADARRLLALGLEKLVINSYAVEEPTFVTQCADAFGSSSVVVSIDVKKSLWGKTEVYTHGGKTNSHFNPVEYAIRMQTLGAGEILINSIDQDGSMQGYDLELIKSITSAVTIPVVACGGAGNVVDLAKAVKIGGASAVAAGSLFVFQGRHRAVLISFPTQIELQKIFSD